MNLHLGCGPIKIPGFINIDHEASHAPDLCIDYLKLGEHFPEGSADCVYSCHSVEHLPWPDGVVRFFAQAFRVLKPGGTLRLCVPDLGLVAAKYIAGQDLKDIYDGPFFTYKDLPATRFMFFARGWEHTVLFDKELLTDLYVSAGFSPVRVCSFNYSPIPMLSGIDRFETESICMEGVKPL
jgi:predicted SAM-dependent methyltransferase